MPPLAAQLQRFLPHLTFCENEPLARHTRFALGGPARWLIDVHQPDILPELVPVLEEADLPWLTLGGGSNLIVADAGYAGIVLRFTGRTIRHENGLTTAEAGAVWQDVVDFHTNHALAGMERMTAIPGWLGGALYGNAGAYGQTIMDFTESVRVFDGQQFREIPREECGFAYRTSGFKARKSWLLVAATLRLAPGDPVQIRDTAAEIMATRNAKFPPSLRCAGSIFKNVTAAALPAATLERVPAELIRSGRIPSAWFLEQVNAKGYRLGGIAVADYHANLIYNDGQGTAVEVCAVIDELKGRVQAEFGFPLEEEVQYIGFSGKENH